MIFPQPAKGPLSYLAPAARGEIDLAQRGGRVSIDNGLCPEIGSEKIYGRQTTAERIRTITIASVGQVAAPGRVGSLQVTRFPVIRIPHCWDELYPALRGHDSLLDEI
jgi:hypothetical protein